MERLLGRYVVMLQFLVYCNPLVNWTLSQNQISKTLQFKIFHVREGSGFRV
jgi:hypothetical protein